MIKKRYLALLSLLLLAGILHFADPFKTWGYLKTVERAYIPLFFLLPLVSFSFRTIRWQFLLESTTRTNFFRLFPVQIAGIALSNLTPGRVGEPAKALLLKKVYDVPASKSLMSIIWERVVDLSIVVTLAILFMLSFLGRLSPDIMLLGQVGIGVMLFGLLVVVFGIHSESAGMKLLALVQRIPVINRLVTEEFVRSFYGTGKIKKRKILLAFVFTLVAWMLDGLTFLLAFRALGVDIAYTFILTSLGFITICGLMSFLPGGIGSADAVLLFALMLMGIDKSQATAGILIARGITLGYCLFVGMLCMLYLNTLHTKAE